MYINTFKIISIDECLDKIGIKKIFNAYALSLSLSLVFIAGSYGLTFSCHHNPRFISCFYDEKTICSKNTFFITESRLGVLHSTIFQGLLWASVKHTLNTKKLCDSTTSSLEFNTIYQSAKLTWVSYTHNALYKTYIRILVKKEVTFR